MNDLSQSPENDFTTALQARLSQLQHWRFYIEKALARAQSLVTYTDIVQSVCQGQRFMFDNGQSFAIVQLNNHPSGIGLFIYVAGGDYKSLCELEKIVVQFGKHMGAKQMSTMGREGFMRRNRPNGWKPTNQRLFVKEI